MDAEDVRLEAVTEDSTSFTETPAFAAIISASITSVVAVLAAGAFILIRKRKNSGL